MFVFSNILYIGLAVYDIAIFESPKMTIIPLFCSYVLIYGLYMLYQPRYFKRIMIEENQTAILDFNFKNLKMIYNSKLELAFFFLLGIVFYDKFEKIGLLVFILIPFIHYFSIQRQRFLTEISYKLEYSSFHSSVIRALFWKAVLLWDEFNSYDFQSDVERLSLGILLKGASNN